MQSVQTLKSFLNLLDRKREEPIKRIFLLLHPSLDDFYDTITSIYNYLDYETPDNIRQMELHPGVLNYTYIKQNSNSDGLTIEIYTIFNPLNEKFSADVDLTKLLERYSSNINVLIFLNCFHHKLTDLINEFNDDDPNDIFELKKNEIIPIIHDNIDPFFDTTKSEWKSCNIILTNVSKWLYKSTNMQIIDFIQQLLRSLLYQQSKTDSNSSKNQFLIYFPFEITDDNFNKMNKLWSSLVGNTLPSSSSSSSTATAASSLSPHFTQSSPIHNSPENTIKYNDIFIESNTDSPKNIILLDDTFDYSEWLSFWNDNPGLHSDNEDSLNK